MELASYLDELRGGQRAWPNDLVLPPSLLTLFGSLYAGAETEGVEQGCFLLYDSTTREFSHGNIASGAKDHMNIPQTDDVKNFGDVHAHPSTSVGHDGGYSAHSPEDLRHFGDFASRDYFIQFVAAGPTVYGMIYIKGLSTWNDQVNSYLGDQSLIQIRANSLPLFTLAGSEDQFIQNKLTAGDDEDDGAEKYALGLKRQIPGYGELVERNSIAMCQRFEAAWSYKFLTWRRS